MMQREIEKTRIKVSRKDWQAAVETTNRKNIE